MNQATTLELYLLSIKRAGSIVQEVNDPALAWELILGEQLYCLWESFDLMSTGQLIIQDDVCC